MPETDVPTSVPQLSGHVIIAGYGIVGRAVAEVLVQRGLPFCVVELNPATVERLVRTDTPIIAGDIREPQVLLRAGIDRAAALALALPDEQQTLAALRVAREMQPSLPIAARCVFTSAGFAAVQLGASAVVVAEQVVAREFASAIDRMLPSLEVPVP